MPVPFLALTDAQLFNACNLVLPAWILLVLAPKAKITQAVVNLSTLAMCLLYALLLYSLVTQPDSKFSYADMASYQGVVALLALPQAALPCWVHYIAFDLWAGRWIAMDAAGRSMPRLLLAPILFFTLMAGPVGLLVYLLVRGNWRATGRHKAE